MNSSAVFFFCKNRLVHVNGQTWRLYFNWLVRVQVVTWKSSRSLFYSLKQDTFLIEFGMNLITLKKKLNDNSISFKGFDAKIYIKTFDSRVHRVWYYRSDKKKFFRFLRKKFDEFHFFDSRIFEFLRFQVLFRDYSVDCIH